MTLSKITTKQQDIVKLLYKHRFLNRIQIQTLMGHKDYKTINVWLKDLRENHYLEWIYDANDFANKTKPAIYHIGLNGIRYLKTLDWHSIEELRKRYRESTRSQTFIDRCLLLADCCITLEQARNEAEFPQTWYFYETEVDYLDGSYYHFLADSELIRPHLCFSKEKYEGGGGDIQTTASYLLEVFDCTMPRYRIKKRLSNYVQYLEEGEWEDETEDNNPPTILLVCPTITDLIYAKRRTRGLIANIWEYDDEERKNIHIRFATADKLKEHGVIAKIWEEA
jgi:hypothetical protein